MGFDLLDMVTLMYCAGRYTSDITYEELTKYFHLPTDKACKKLGVGLTILKRLCRRFGLARWPYKRPRKSDKKNTTAISADRDDDFSKEYAPAEAMSEEQQEREIKLDASPVVGGSEVVENPNVSTDRAENDLQGPGMVIDIFFMILFPVYELMERRDNPMPVSCNTKSLMQFFHCRSPQHGC